MVHHGAALARESVDSALPEAVASGEFDTLPPRVAALCRYGLKLTLRPWDMEEDDLAALRAEGLSDRDIVDANQVVAYFNYVNRVADGLGVELEGSWPEQLRWKRRYSLRQR
ncbi:MAG: peroxidase [Actinomycetota bacterium]|nr:peroxidase [Actinomycetota bacterium]